MPSEPSGGWGDPVNAGLGHIIAYENLVATAGIYGLRRKGAFGRDTHSCEGKQAGDSRPGDRR